MWQNNYINLLSLSKRFSSYLLSFTKISKNSLIHASPPAAHLKEVSPEYGLQHWVLTPPLRYWHLKKMTQLNRLGWQALLSFLLYVVFLTYYINTNNSKKSITMSFNKPKMGTTPYTGNQVECWHCKQEQLEQFMSHWRYWWASTNLSYKNKPPSSITLQAQTRTSLCFYTYRRNPL